MADDRELLVFSGSASPALTTKVCDYLGIPQGKGEVLRFPEGNLFVRISENVRGRHIYLIQSIAFPPNDNFVELLFWIDAFKRASAASVTAVVPYFSYAKGDKKDEPRVAIRARVCADAIEAAGAGRVVTMDLHAAQVQGFFRVPVDVLYGLPVLCDGIRREGLSDLVVVSPDTGFAKQARKYAAYLEAPLAIADKERLDHHGSLVVCDIIGDVAGKTALIVDDFTVSAGTLVKVGQKLVEKGAKAVYAAVTHGVFCGDAMERLDASPIQRLFVTDTVEAPPVTFSAKVEVISAAPLFGEAIRRIHNHESISVLFPV